LYKRIKEIMPENIFEENEEWEKRKLCSDESCIGTIGPGGKCRECGKSYESKLSEEQREDNVHVVVDAEKVPVNVESDDDWEKRILCSDESCIGTIGSNGKCRECGKPLH
jgi:hypothetical protein